MALHLYQQHCVALCGMTHAPVARGNLMGDFGARMLAKALQINTDLQTVFWDRNGTTAQGFQDIAEALEK